jgi:hypothetical protein
MVGTTMMEVLLLLLLLLLLLRLTGQKDAHARVHTKYKHTQKTSKNWINCPSFLNPNAKTRSWEWCQ